MLYNVKKLVTACVRTMILTLKTYCNVEQSQQRQVVMFSPCGSVCVCVCVCVIVAKRCQGDTYSSDKCGLLGVHTSVCLSVDRFCMCDVVRNPAR